MRLLAFALALLLLAGAVDPTTAWLIALVTLTGIGAFRPHLGHPFLRLRPMLDVRLASFVLAVLLLAGIVDANKEWLIALSVVTGVAAFFPRIISLDSRAYDSNEGYWRRHTRNWRFDWGRDGWQ